MTSRSASVGSIKRGKQQAAKREQPNTRRIKTMNDTAETTKETKTRGDGPIAFAYGNAEASDHKRIPDGVTKVVAKGKSGDKVGEYNLASLTEPMIRKLAAQAIASRIKVYVTNHGQKDGSDAVALADEVWGEFVDGNLYTRAEGKGGPGRPFDPTLWVEAFRLMNENSVKRKAVNKAGNPIALFSAEQLDMLKTKLVSMEPAKRQAELKGYRANDKLMLFYKQAEGAAALAKIKSAGKGETEDELELPI